MHKVYLEFISDEAKYFCDVVPNEAVQEPIQ